jgi:hypothetical protein
MNSLAYVGTSGQAQGMKTLATRKVKSDKLKEQTLTFAFRLLPFFLRS